MLAIWSLVPLPFLKPAWTSGSLQFRYCWSLGWAIVTITLLACEMSAIVRYFEHSLALPFFGIGMKTDLFQSCGHRWVFQICWHIEYSTFTASSFRIWNSSAEMSSPLLAFFVVMLYRPTWLHIPGCLALGEWSHHRDYLENIFRSPFWGRTLTSGYTARLRYTTPLAWSQWDSSLLIYQSANTTVIYT